jgi:hypothetical protein
MARKNNQNQNVAAAQATATVIINNAQEGNTMAAQNMSQETVNVNTASQEKEESTMNNQQAATIEVMQDTINHAKEEGNMSEQELSMAQQMLSNMKQGLANGRRFVGKAKSQVVEGLDEDVESVKATMFMVTNKLGVITGLTQFREDVMVVLEEGIDKGTFEGLEDMSAKVRELFNARIAKLNKLGTEQSLKKAMELSKGCNILEQGIVALMWIARTIAKKLKEWFGFENETVPAPKVLKAICAGIKAVFGFAWTVGKIVVTVVGRVLSYAVAGIIKLAAWIVNTVKTLYFKAKAFVQGKIQDIKANADEEEFEDDFDDEDLETC